MAETITTKQAFLDKVAGRKLVQDDSWVVLSPAGTVEGEGPTGGKITGGWVWDDIYYCRNLTIDGTALEPDCQTVHLDGDTVTFTHEKGEGISISWTLA